MEFHDGSVSPQAGGSWKSEMCLVHSCVTAASSQQAALNAILLTPLFGNNPLSGWLTH